MWPQSSGDMSEGTRPSRLRRLLERRSPWEFVAGYLFIAWVALQVTDTLASLVGLPLWFGAGVLTLLGAGLFVVLITALLQLPLKRRSSTVSAGEGRLRRVFTWRRAALVGVGGLSILGLLTVAHLTARALGIGSLGTLVTRGVLAADGQLVLADLEDHAGDPAATAALTQALRVHLSQSPTITLLSASRVGEVLERMAADTVTTLTAERAREVAQREGLKAVIAGALHGVGSRYTVTARVVAAESGEELLTVIETAGSADELIPAVERLSIRLRERIGESLVSVRSSPPLSRVRTASLAALKAYTAGNDANSRGDFERCALLMDEAIALDSLFAMAYEGRAACNQNLRRDYAQQVEDRLRAYEMRERMTDHERLRFTAVFHQFVTRDRRQAVAAWEAYLEQYPERTSALFALANLYAEGRDWARAEQTLQKGLEAEPSSLIVLINLGGYQINQGRIAEAEETYARLARELPAVDLSWWLAAMWLARTDWAAAEQAIEAGRERARGNVMQDARMAGIQGHFALIRGRLAEGEQRLREAMTTERTAGDVELYLIHAFDLATTLAHVRADTATALALIREVLRQHPLESLEPLQRPYLELAEAYAATGETELARARVADWERDVAGRIPGQTVPHWVRAALAAAEARYEDAIIDWRREDGEREDPLPALVHIGSFYDRIGQADSARVYYERYLTTNSRIRYHMDARWRGPVLERLAELYDERGEPETARSYRARFVELWAGADPELQPRVNAARARLTRDAPARRGATPSR